MAELDSGKNQKNIISAIFEQLLDRITE